MNKLQLILLTLILSSFTFQVKAQEEDIPSIGDIISNVLDGDNAYKSYNAISKNEQNVCIMGEQQEVKYVDKSSFYQAWGFNCLVLNNSELCKDVRPADKLICNEPAKTKWYSNVWEKTKACGSGIKKSWQEYYEFMKQIGKYLFDKESRQKTNQKISKAWTSMKSYLATETTKYQDAHKVGKKRAFLAVTANMMKKFTKGLNQMLYQMAPKVGCYNYKAKTRVICQVLAEFFVEPIILFKFVRLGPKVLKGTRIARFFKFHKASAGRKVANVSKKIMGKGSDIKIAARKIDFLPADSPLAKNVIKNDELYKSVKNNQEVFNEIFPDKKDLDQLNTYLELSDKQASDDLAQLLKVLSEDKSKMSKQKYQSFIDDLKESIAQSCKR